MPVSVISGLNHCNVNVRRALQSFRMHTLAECTALHTRSGNAAKKHITLQSRAAMQRQNKRDKQHQITAISHSKYRFKTRKMSK